MSDAELTELRLQIILIKLIAEKKGQEAFNVMKYIGMK